MHILGADQRRPRKDRSNAEKALQRLNTIVVAIQLACLLIVVAQLSMAAGKSFNSNFFGLSQYSVSDKALLNTTCELVTTTTSNQFSSYGIVLSYLNIPWMLSKNVNDVRTCLAANAVLIAIGAINKLFFDFNAHQFRYHHLIFRKEVFTVWEMLALVVSFVTTKSVERNGNLIAQYLVECGNSNGNAYVYISPFVPIYISLSILTAAHFVTILLALKNMLKKHPKDDLTRTVDEFGVEADSEPEQHADFEFEPDEQPSNVGRGHNARHARAEEGNAEMQVR